MISEVLLYGNINAYSARQFVVDVAAVGANEIQGNINSDGGEVRYGWGAVTRWAQITAKKTLVNDGECNSMAAMLFCYSDYNKCADYATFGFHRAAYADWFEADPEMFDAEAQADLAKINSNLKKALEAKVDADIFKEVTGVSIKDLFSMKGRPIAVVDAKGAKKMGLVDEILLVTPKKKKEIEALKQTITARFSGAKVAAEKPEPEKEKDMEKTITTVAEFKANYPELFKEIVTAERERCETWAVFADVDLPACQKGIADGAMISPKMQAEFIRKQISAETVKKVEDENPDAIALAAATGGAKTAADAAKEKEQAAILAAVAKMAAM